MSIVLFSFILVLFFPFTNCTPNCDFGGCCQCLSRQRFPLLLSFSRRNFDVRDMLHHSSSTQSAGPASASARPSPTCATDSELKLHCPGSRAFRFQQPVPACSPLLIINYYVFRTDTDMVCPPGYLMGIRANATLRWKQEDKIIANCTASGVFHGWLWMVERTRCTPNVNLSWLMSWRSCKNFVASEFPQKRIISMLTTSTYQTAGSTSSWGLHVHSRMINLKAPSPHPTNKL